VSGERYLGSGNTDRHESLHDGRSVIWKELLPFGGDIFRGHQIDLPTLDLGILGLPPLPSPLLHSLPFLPSFSPPLPPSLSPGATPLNQLEGMGSAASSPTGAWGKAPPTNDQQFGASEPKGAALVATVFVSFHKNELKFLYKH